MGASTSLSIGEPGEGGGGGGAQGRALKPKQYARLSNEVKYKKGTIYSMWSMWYNQHFEIC